MVGRARVGGVGACDAPWHVGFRVLIGDADGNPPGSRDGFRAYVKEGLDEKLARRTELYADV